jgi:gluconokinase
MGVSGSGKSTIGVQLGAALGLEFLEGDSLHSQRNVARMASGVALTDEDRQEWLDLLSKRLAQAQKNQLGLVVSCSALKRSYRDILRRGASGLVFVHLTGDPALLAQRASRRVGHYMPASLLPSQLETLEIPDPDEHALTFDVAQSPQAIVKAVTAALARKP